MPGTSLLSRVYNEEVQAEGRLVARFQSPAGIVRGRATVNIDRLGRVRIQVAVESLETSEDLHDPVWSVMMGQKPTAESENRIVFGIGTSSNVCDGLEIEVDGGRLIVEGSVSYDHNAMFGGVPPEELCIRFYPMKTTFQASDCGPAVYWAMPLTNFTFEPAQRFLAKEEHPVSLSSLDRQLHGELTVTDRPIVFEVSGSTCFIERLPSYEAIVADLEAERLDMAVTGQLVGEFPDESEGALADVPFAKSVLNVIGLASGNRVGTPWAEAFDSEGRLVWRRYFGAGVSRYSRFRGLIGDDWIGRGLGYFLGFALSHNLLTDKRFIAAIHHALAGKSSKESLEVQLGHLFRGLDSMCELHGTDKQRLRDQLDPADRDAVNSLLKATAMEVRNLSKQRKEEGRVSEGAALYSIGERIMSNPMNVDRRFGDGVLLLTQLLGFSDGEICATAYARASGGAIAWTSLLTRLRGHIMHGGYFSVEDGEHDLGDLGALYRHCQDLLARAILKSIGYDSEYLPPHLPLKMPVYVDWVTPETQPHMLGYDHLTFALSTNDS